MLKYTIIMLVIFTGSAHAENKIRYPERAQSLRIGGNVDVVYDINRYGQTENIRFTRTDPKYVFERSVEKQILSWRFDGGKEMKNVPLHIDFKSK